MIPDIFVLTFMTWDHVWNTAEFGSLDAVLEHVESQEDLDKPDKPQYIIQFSGKGQKVKGWSKREIETILDDRFKVAHADEIAAEKVRREKAAQKRAEELAAQPAYVRDRLTEFGILTDAEGHEHYSFNGVVLPFRLTNVEITADPIMSEIRVDGRGPVAQYQHNMARKLVITINLSDAEQFRVFKAER